MIKSVEEFERVLDENISVEGGFSKTDLYKKSMKPQIEQKFPIILEKIEEINLKISKTATIKTMASSNGELTEETISSIESFLADLTIEESLEIQYQMIDTEELLTARGTILHSTIGYVISTLKSKMETLGDSPQAKVCKQLLEESMNAREALINEIFGELNQKAQALDYMKMYLKNYLAYIIKPMQEYSSQIITDEAELSEMDEKQTKKNQAYQKIEKVLKIANNIQMMIDKVKGPVDDLIEKNGLGEPLYPPFINSVSSIKTENYITFY